MGPSERTQRILTLAIALLITLGWANVLYADCMGLVQKEVPASAAIALQQSGVCGDQNADGEVDVFDAIIDLQIIVGLIEPTAEQQRLSNVAPDGTIDIFDVILTLQHIVGLTEISECGFPVGITAVYNPVTDTLTITGDAFDNNIE